MSKKNKPLGVLIIGAGNRGMYAFGELCKREDIDIKVLGVADPDEEKRKKMSEEHNIPEERCYKTGDEALRQEKFCDAVINTTPDKVHYEIAIKAIEKGYHLLLEKPMATSPQDCVDITNAQRKSDNVLTICHVLRYAPFFQEIKGIIESKELGKILSMDLLEEIGYWHYVHSYVRGNWRKKQSSGPIILTKSCHDMDILSWLLDKDVKSISSSGSRGYFRKSNTPRGAVDRCIKNCKVKKTCPFNAERFYLHEKTPEEVSWPTYVISPIDKTLKARKISLRTGPYGRCAYKCDNNVCDNQEVIIRFSGGVKARFTLSAFGPKPTRKIRIYLEKGEIHGDLSEGSIRKIKYSGVKEADEVMQIDVPFKDHHGGGDEFILKSFVKSIKTNNPKYNLTSAEETLKSHLMCFAAEESRLKGKLVNFQKYKNRLKGK